jgi:hypothetical protein
MADFDSVAAMARSSQFIVREAQKGMGIGRKSSRPARKMGAFANSPSFFRPAGSGSLVAQGKEERRVECDGRSTSSFNGRSCVCWAALSRL